MPDIKEKLVELMGDFYGVDPMYFGVDAPAIAKHLADNGVTIQEWISVEERLPEYGDKVLVCYTREDYVGIGVLQKGFEFMDEKDQDYWLWSGEEYPLDEFTHWMHLPEPPKGE